MNAFMKVSLLLVGPCLSLASSCDDSGQSSAAAQDWSGYTVELESTEHGSVGAASGR